MKVGYVRVSTREQNENDSLVQQTARVQKAGAVLMFSDIESGRSDTRKEFNKMLSLCKAGKVTEIIVTRIDRLARSVVTIHKTLSQLEKLKVKLNVLDAPIDTTNSFGWFSVSQMASLAEFESRLMSERIKHGFNYFREQNKASSQPPFGYKRLNEKYAPNDTLHKSGKTYWEIAKEIISIYLSNNSTLRSTCSELLDKYGISRCAVGLRHWFLNPTLRGHTAYNQQGNLQNPQKWDVRYNTHEGLITETEYQLICKKLNTNKQKHCYGRQRKTNAMPISFVYCGECGGRCFTKTSKYSYRVRCGTHDTKGNLFCTNGKSVYLKDIIATLDSELRSRYQQLAVVVSQCDRPSDNSELAARYQQVEMLKSMPQSPLIADTISRVMDEIEQIKQQESVVSTVSNDLVDKLRSAFSDPALWEEVPDTEKKQVYDTLVDKIIIRDGQILEIKLLV